jgi:hypothetical protein
VQALQLRTQATRELQHMHTKHTEPKRERAGADVRVSVRAHGVPALLQTAALLTLLRALLHQAQ